MKMNCITIMAGVFFILVGLGILLRVLGIDLPLVRIFFALVFIFIGVKILFPGQLPWCFGVAGEARSVVFGEGQAQYQGEGGAEYSTVFGSQKVDLTQVDLAKGEVRIKLSAVFGSLEAQLPANVPVKVSGQAAFGALRFPNGGQVAFGSDGYTSAGYAAGKPALLIDANVVFGEINLSAAGPQEKGQEKEKAKPE